MTIIDIWKGICGFVAIAVLVPNATTQFSSADASPAPLIITNEQLVELQSKQPSFGSLLEEELINQSLDGKEPFIHETQTTHSTGR